MQDDALNDIEHWTQQLSRTVVQAGPLQKKLNSVPIPELTYEERYQLREILMQFQVNTNLLRKRVHLAKSEKTFWQRIFKK